MKTSVIVGLAAVAVGAAAGYYARGLLMQDMTLPQFCAWKFSTLDPVAQASILRVMLQRASEQHQAAPFSTVAQLQAYVEGTYNDTTDYFCRRVSELA